MATQRGRKSANHLSVVGDPEGKTIALSTRPAPPENFRQGSEEYELWNLIVGAQVPEWFTDGDLPLLEAYCTASRDHKRCSEVCRHAPFTIFGPNGGESANPVFGIQTKLAGTMSSLAVKLRLSQSTRYDEKKAATLAKQAQGASGGASAGVTRKKKPWETE